eukprot:351934-Chlamydomonas_euryale.AAC.10
MLEHQCMAAPAASLRQASPRAMRSRACMSGDAVASGHLRMPQLRPCTQCMHIGSSGTWLCGMGVFCTKECMLMHACTGCTGALAARADAMHVQQLACTNTADRVH